MTDKELLDCLTDRPCAVCRFHEEKGCTKWGCVFDEREQEPKVEWIPVSERLPKDHDWYLIVVKEKSTGYQYIPRVASHFHNNDWYLIDAEDADKDWLDDLECIAWCPLPEPYKESEVQDADSD